MSFLNNIFNGMARGFAFGVTGFNPYFGMPCCCNNNLLFMTSNPFMGGFFPVMPQISMPIFNMTAPTWDFSSMNAINYPMPDFSSIFDRPKVVYPKFSDIARGNFDFFEFSNTRKSPDSSSTERRSLPKSNSSQEYVSTKDKYYTEMRDFIIRELEGGYSNRSNDRGKETLKGVTQRTYNSYRKLWGKPTQNIKKITDDEVDKIYYAHYIDSGADKIDNPRLALYVFAQAINSGPEKAKELLKQSGGDIDKYEQLQRARYERLANQAGQGDNRKGWQNRVTKTKDFAMSKLPDNMEVCTA